MEHSPGHKRHPDHHVIERPVGRTMHVEVDGDLVAESDDVIEVDEDGHPARYYFPRADIEMDKLHRTDTTTRCPFKGLAHYFSIDAGGDSLQDAAWSYEDPYLEHAALKDRVAFYEDKVPQIAIKPAP